MGVRGKSGSASAPPPQAPPAPSKPAAAAEPTQEAQQESPPPAGHNKPPAPATIFIEDPELRQRCYYEVTQAACGITAQEKKLKEELKTLSDQKKQIFKEGKAKLGFNRKDFDYGIALKSSVEAEDGGSAALDEHRRRLQIAVWEEHPIATQPDLFGDERTVDRTPSVERAYNKGKVVGMRGLEACNPPTTLGTAQQQEWMKGWHAGQEALIRSKIKQQTTAPTEGGLWPDDPKPEEPLGTIYDPENEHPDPDATNDDPTNVVPIGTAASTAEAL